MKNSLFVAIALVSGAAQAQTTYIYAPVRSTVVIQEQVLSPRKVCETRTVQREVVQQAPTYGGALVGGIAGGAVGSLFGQGDGKLLATALGAALGSHVGHAQDNPSSRTVEPVSVTDCKTVDTLESRVSGYRVTYEYAGQLYETTLPRDPGPTLKVAVSVSPVAN